MLSRQVLYRKKENTFHNANMPCSALSVILFIHCSTAFYDPVIIISQSYHHFKATSELCSSMWYNPTSTVRAWKGGVGARCAHTNQAAAPTARKPLPCTASHSVQLQPVLLSTVRLLTTREIKVVVFLGFGPVYSLTFFFFFFLNFNFFPPA